MAQDDDFEFTDRNGERITQAADFVGGKHYPIYKLAVGVDGSVTLVSDTDPLPIVLRGADGTAIEVDGNHLGVVNHAHSEGGHIHFKAAISATTDFILIDLSDTTTYPHSNTSWVHASNMVMGIDASADADYLVQIGFLENVDATNGDFHGVYDISGSRKVGVNKDVDVFRAPESPKMRSEAFIGPAMLNQTAFQTDVNLGSTVDPTSADTPSGNGDVALRVTIAAGAIELSILMGYHTH